MKHSAYLQLVRRHGYDVNLPLVQRGCEMQVGSASPGTRNSVLHRKAHVLIHLGLDPWCLEAHALSSGLKPDEVFKVIDSAQRRFDPARVPDVLTAAQCWAAAVTPGLPPTFHTLVMEVVRMAVEQNTMRPMVTTTLVNDSVDRSTTSKRLKSMVEKGLLERITLGGRRPNGMSRSYCYRLVLPSPGGDELAG